MNNSGNYTHMVPAWANDSPSTIKDSVIQPSSDPIINPNTDENEIYATNFKQTIDNEMAPGNNKTYNNIDVNPYMSDPSMTQINNTLYNSDDGFDRTFQPSLQNRNGTMSRPIMDDVKEQVYDMFNSAKKEFIGLINSIRKKGNAN